MAGAWKIKRNPGGYAAPYAFSSHADPRTGHRGGQRVACRNHAHERGRHTQAEILCHKALYQARSKQEICICLCAEQILARIFILRGDVDSFFTALENIRNYGKDSSHLHVLHMVDICLSVISVALDTTDFVANWLCDIESIRKKVYARALPYTLILYSHLLVRERRHAELLGMIDSAINVAKEMNYVYPQLYSFIFKSRVYYTCGQKREALESLQKAFTLAVQDKVYLPFAQFTYMGDILTKVRTSLEEGKYAKHMEAIPQWKEAMDEIIALYHRYHKGRMTILNALNQSKSPLTPREREVAILAKARLSHQEIADKLYISKATVRTILYNAYNKLGIHSKAELYKIDL